MRYAGLMLVLMIMVLSQSSPVATQPWNLPRPVLLNGCTENALIIAVKTCARDSGCASGLARYGNVDPPMTVCCQNGQWGLMERRTPTYCKLYARIPVKPVRGCAIPAVAGHCVTAMAVARTLWHVRGRVEPRRFAGRRIRIP